METKLSSTGPAYEVPFTSAEEVWFWFIAARGAQLAGARDNPQSGTPRPCEPVDILNIINRLYRGRVLKMNHFQVLKFYGERFMRPQRHHPRESRAAQLWDEAMDRLSESFIRHGLMIDDTPFGASRTVCHG
jgi:hypothetical protein